MRVRVADPSRDGARAAEIYRPHVIETLTSFEEVAPTADDMAERMRSTLEWTPWLVADCTVRGAMARTRSARGPPRFAWASTSAWYMAAIPGARLEWVPGGHLIDPAGPGVLAFVRSVLHA